MKKTIIFILTLVSTSIAYPQSVIYDEDGVISDVTRLGLGPGKVSKDTLSYFVDTSSTEKLSASEFIQAVQSSFNEWSNHSIFTFYQVTSSDEADFKIKFVASANHGDGVPFRINELAHSFVPNENVYCGEMHILDAVEWATDGSANKYDLQTTVTHEIGHLLGLLHSNESEACLYQYYLSNGGHTLHIDDCNRIWNLYGFPSGKVNIAGDMQLLIQNDYYVRNLPRGASLSWNFTDEVPSNVSLVTYPNNINLCTVSQSERTQFNTNLSATIKYGYIKVRNLTKYIYSTEGFTGTYSQMGYAQNNAFTPDGPPIPIHLNSELVLYSPNFVGRTISHSGVTPSYFYYDNNKTIRIVLSNAYDGQRLYVHANSNTGTSYLITLRVTTYGTDNIKDISLNVQDDNLKVSLIDTESDADRLYELSDDMDNLYWHYEIINPINKRKMKEQDATGPDSYTNVSEWEKGLYLVRATIGGNILTKKINIR